MLHRLVYRTIGSVSGSDGRVGCARHTHGISELHQAQPWRAHSRRQCVCAHVHVCVHVCVCVCSAERRTQKRESVGRVRDSQLVGEMQETRHHDARPTDLQFRMRIQARRWDLRSKQLQA